MLDKVHEYTRIPGTMEVRLVHQRPYLRLRSGAHEPPIFVQEGVFYSEGGDLMGDPPEWLDEELAKVSPEGLSAVGLVMSAAAPHGVVPSVVCNRNHAGCQISHRGRRPKADQLKTEA
jgi:hypothetical protein